MPELKTHGDLIERIPDWLTANANGESGLTLPGPADVPNQQGWQNLIDRYLLKWAEDPSQLDDPAEELFGPSKDLIHFALLIADQLRQRDFPAPISACSTGEGGVALNWKEKTTYLRLEIRADRSAEIQLFHDSKLRLRKLLD